MLGAFATVGGVRSMAWELYVRSCLTKDIVFGTDEYMILTLGSPVWLAYPETVRTSYEEPAMQHFPTLS